MQGCYYVGLMTSACKPVYDELEKKWLHVEKDYFLKLIEKAESYGIAIAYNNGNITLFYKSAAYPKFNGESYHKWQYTSFYFEIHREFNKENYTCKEKTYVSSILSGNTDIFPDNYERTEEGYKRIK